ncbi:MAG: hypothetical protein DI498_14895 [Paracoccus denitrificans]|nr:MAG: hypothetical protein DI498_14895 [Paracoccus denitrificans]PZO82578.1 MAG: hypothetical protein DI633_14895 [Paracoccus denitrificans]
MLLIFLNNILFHQIHPSRFNRYLINHSTLKKWLLIEVLVLHYLMTELKIYLVMVVEQNI